MKWLAPVLVVALALPLLVASDLSAACAEGQIDINTATEAQLRTVKGIGPKRAEAIIEGRPYSSVDDLRKVKGIGEKTLESMRPSLCVGKAAPAAKAVEADLPPAEEAY
ncbi:MAG: helix-hairpin-helix domain-containing protein [bacterium]|nr:helix-hairpin-helix domain-containing protein [bacterium]